MNGPVEPATGPDRAPDRQLTTAAEATANPAGRLLAGAGWPGLGATAVLAAVASVTDLSNGASALVGGVMALAALVVGPALQWICRGVDPNLLLGVAVLAYGLVVGLVWLVYSLVSDASWLSGGWAGVGVLAAAVAWVAGYMRASSRLRLPLYENEDSTAGR